MSLNLKPDPITGVAPSIKSTAANAQKIMQQKATEAKIQMQEQLASADKGTVIFIKDGDPVFNCKLPDRTGINFVSGKYLVTPDDPRREMKLKVLEYFIEQKLLRKEIVE